MLERTPARAQPFLERRDVPRRTVAGDHDLFLRLVQGVERVEKLLLRPLLAGQELDVVDEEKIDVAIALLEVDRLLEADGVDELVHEGLATDVEVPDSHLAPQHLVADGLHQVGLPEPDATVDIQRVVGAGRLLGDGGRRGVGELVARADHERVEGVARVQPGPERPWGVDFERGAVPRRVAARRRFAVRDGGRARRLGLHASLGEGPAARGCRPRRHAGLPAGEMEVELARFDLPRALLDQRQVIPADPVSEQQAGYFYVQRALRECQLLRRLEPGVEALSVDLQLQAGEDSVPEIHARPAAWAAFARSLRSKAMPVAPRLLPSLIFSTAFPQVWKSFGAAKR